MGKRGTVLDQYTLELERVASILLVSLANDLGTEQVADMFKEGLQTVRINYYPPCHHADKVLGLSPHSDAEGLTLLLQINEAEGLQLKKNGQWMPIKPLPNVFIVNNGDDTLEIMSNGKYKSIEHRAVINPQKECMPIATFVMPWLDVTIVNRSNSEACGRE
ncbi:protein SRG1-like isoform X2 [Dioscorea cayenensis subsp. rotundata]|uniref:Protein SRG1-like isoform X2 n=1 Tax=Dioscorea cayennensis subsp. rotundata TaxID=55577 RepID=A0AB40CUW6_DIOCR|nr:protein SRG1-like isoform X2 [Dioscorea cayenensis subsp. rotundata]